MIALQRALALSSSRLQLSLAFMIRAFPYASVHRCYDWDRTCYDCTFPNSVTGQVGDNLSGRAKGNESPVSKSCGYQCWQESNVIWCERCLAGWSGRVYAEPALLISSQVSGPQGKKSKHTRGVSMDIFPVTSVFICGDDMFILRSYLWVGSQSWEHLQMLWNRSQQLVSLAQFKRRDCKPGMCKYIRIELASE